MMINSFKEMYIAELQELADAERQLAQCWPRLAEKASHASLKDAFARYGEETTAQQQRLERILQQHGASASEHSDQAMQALIGETAKMAEMLDGGALCDAGLISSAQRIAHYEMAAFGTAAALAGQLGLHDEQRALHACVEEEKQADMRLTAIARSEANPDALRAQ